MTSLNRQEHLIDWVKRSDKIEIEETKLLAGDASFRKYYRVTGKLQGKLHGDSLVLVDAPPPESLEPFVSVAKAYAEAGVRVPEILSADHELGSMLLEDIGDQLLLGGADDVAERYRKAIDMLPQIMSVRETRLGALPLYDRALLQRENDLFINWLVGDYLGISLDKEETQLWETFNRKLIENALKQNQVGVHRDFHSRNLMVNSNQELVAIDFQDAVLGPVTYDLVSLLRDCYVDWSHDFVDELVGYGFDTLKRKGILDASKAANAFGQEFDWMGLQRHTKASGIFARLFLRDGKASFLQDIPHTVNYMVDITERYSDCHEFHDWLKSKIVPALGKAKVS